MLTVELVDRGLLVRKVEELVDSLFLEPPLHVDARVRRHVRKTDQHPASRHAAELADRGAKALEWQVFQGLETTGNVELSVGKRKLGDQPQGIGLEAFVRVECVHVHTEPPQVAMHEPVSDPHLEDALR